MSAVATREPGTAPTGTRLLAACRRLRDHGILAVGEAAGDPADVRARLTEALLARFPHASGSLVFWSEAGVVGAEGDLRAPVTLHYAGPGVADAVRAALAEQGLSVREGIEPLTLCVLP